MHVFGTGRKLAYNRSMLIGEALLSLSATRDGPKRSSAKEFGRMFGSATCDYSAELRQTFGFICGFAFAAFCARHWR